MNARYLWRTESWGTEPALPDIFDVGKEIIRITGASQLKGLEDGERVGGCAVVTT
jgi:hypothetical protein